MKSKAKFIIDIVQWLLIVALIGVCVKLVRDGKKYADRVTAERTETSYKLIYYGQNLRELKKENKSLYEMVDSLQNVKSAIEIKYVYKYFTDTIYVPMMDVNEKDSLYTYKYDNDTVAFKMQAKAKEMEWMTGEFSVNDSFKIITTEQYGQYTTTINHSNNVDIVDATVWRPKKKWYEHFHYGPSVGLGYGLVNKNFDVFLGGAITYEF